MLILGIETSCDETACALLRDGREIVADFVASQVELHRRFGGVVPEIACRAHMECLLPGLADLMQRRSITAADIDAIAVTHKPGLIGALLVGVTAAKALALAWQKPLLGVDHLEAHIAACRLAAPEMRPPYVALVASGGHTALLHVRAKGCRAAGAAAAPDGEYEPLGKTRDDAAGEAFDKVAKILDLGFPGGPAIERAAAKGNPRAFAWRQACLPADGFDFSFSGIKTAVLYASRGMAQGGRGPLLLDRGGIADAAASFQAAVVHALVSRAQAAARATGAKWLAVGGGVAANGILRRELAKAADELGCRLAIPEPRLCTDNAIMVAARAYELWQQGVRHDLNLEAVATQH